MSRRNHNRRHRVLIDLPVQMGMALRLIGLWAATMLLASVVAVLIQFFSDPQSGLFDHLLDPRHWLANVIALAVTLPIAVLHLFRFSHRFAGPVFRLRKELRGLAARGSAPPLKFRKGDYWLEMADEFNAVAELVDSLAKNRRELQPEDTAEPLASAGGGR